MPSVLVSVLDENLSLISTVKGAGGVITVKNVNLWWPYTMSNKSYAYLYTLEVGEDSLLKCVGVRVESYLLSHFVACVCVCVYKPNT